MKKQKLETIRINQNNDIPYVSEGEFSTHELLEHLLKQTGAADVRLSSFSITEQAIRFFFNAQSDGLIASLSCLLDFNVKRHKLGLLFFASNVVSKIRLTKIHAKLIFIDNQNYHLVVVTSSNLNKNDKIETGIIISHPELYQFYSEAFNGWFQNALTVSPDEFNDSPTQRY